MRLELWQRNELERVREQVDPADLRALQTLVGSVGWQRFVLPFMRAYKRAATDAARSAKCRGQAGLRDYFDGQCAAFDDLVRQIHGLLGDRSDRALGQIDVEEDELLSVHDPVDEQP